MPIETLIENLSDQVELHAILLESLELESSLPASCSIQELEELHSVRDMAVQNVAAVEKSRLKLMEAYQVAHRVSGSISLKDIIKKCNKTDQKRLTALRAELKQLLENIQQTSKKNAGRAVARMACFNEIQGNLQKTFKRIPTYSMRGVLNRPKGAYFVKRSI